MKFLKNMRIDKSYRYINVNLNLFGNLTLLSTPIDDASGGAFNKGGIQDNAT